MKDEAPAIDANGLTKYFGPFMALHEMSFTVATGSVVALLGANGAGKSTTLRLLTGFLTPSAGTVRICGHDIAKARIEAARTIGYLPENGPLYHDMTPRQSLRFLAEARAIPSHDSPTLMAAAATQCDIDLLLDKPIGELSRGQRQRVGLAQALLHDPPVLILDEPTAGLDPLQARQFRALIAGLRQRKTVLLSTHLLQEAEALADQLLIVDHGRLAFNGTVDALRGGRSIEDAFYGITQPQ